LCQGNQIARPIRKAHHGLSTLRRAHLSQYVLLAHSESGQQELFPKALSTALQDAILNAVVVPDFTAELTNISLRTKNLDKIEHLFHAYLDTESSKQT
jgi:cellobiose-specific phosphotransferase system component IIA